MSLAKIKNALITAFEAGAFFSQSNVAWPNVYFEPTTATPWAQINFEPEPRNRAVTLGPTGFNDQRGFLQVLLCYPLGKGDSEVNAKADAICAAFPTGRKLISSGQEVVIVSSGRSGGYESEGWYKVPVTIFFYAHVYRS